VGRRILPEEWLEQDSEVGIEIEVTNWKNTTVIQRQETAGMGCHSLKVMSDDLLTNRKHFRLLKYYKNTAAAAPNPAITGLIGPIVFIGIAPPVDSSPPAVGVAPPPALPLAPCVALNFSAPAVITN
jgi:hypothetical protein